MESGDMLYLRFTTKANVMNEVKKYKVVHAIGFTNLEDYVNRELAQKWQPFGSVVVYTENGPEKIGGSRDIIYHFLQPMVKY